MATIQRFEELTVWQDARMLSGQVYELTQTGAFSKEFELKNQINGSSGSVMDNIAEGFGRGSRAEFKQFLGFSLGSVSEVKPQLYRAYDRKHINEHFCNALYEDADKITKKLISLMIYWGESSYKGVKFMSEDEIEYQTINQRR
ncbi:four helix bundle protein [Spirosoma sp. SC4-14]|uniref:four helix bundle protein n=1 Tax=Spirosoma sp. SC4-14 TaxID=3128900 RepID=UPI0030D5D496